jgi:hypothetical protein
LNPIAERRVPITLGGVERVLVFNLNSFTAYEEATDKFFLDTVATLYDVVTAAREKAIAAKDLNANGDPRINPLEVIRHVSMKALRALLWASLHEYDKSGEPHWPLTISQVGRLLQPEDIVPVFTSFLKGQSLNSPTREEMGESAAQLPKAATAPAEAAPAVQSNGTAGGERSIELPVDAFT